MMRQWAIAVGINQYQHFQPLNYAQRDAQALWNFWVTEARFSPDRCLLLTDTSPTVAGKSTYPTQENIQSWLDLLSQRYVQPEDILWCFFSGYGVCYRGQDYLVPIDADPRALETSAIPLKTLFQQLQSMPTKTVLLLLDINRAQGMLSNETLGLQTVNLATDTGVATVLSCQPGQFSRESSALGHGFFTAALLESLRDPYCTTLEKLDKYLSDRLPQLNEHYWRPIQQPLTISTPEKFHQAILLQAGVSNLQAGVSNPIDGMLADRTPEAIAQPPFPLLDANPTAVHAHGVRYPMTHDSSANSDPQTEALENGQIEERSPDAGNYLNPLPPERAGSTPDSDNRSADLPASSPAAFSVHPETEAMPDVWFWRPVLLWGGLAVVVLSLGVLGRNWTALTQGMQPMAQQSSSPSHPTQSSPAPASIAQGSTGAKGPTVSPAPAATVSTQPKAIAAKPLDPGAPSRPANPALNLIASRSPAPQFASPVQPKPGAQANTIQASPTPVAIAKPPMPKSILEIARSKTVIKSDQASDYWFAIQEAKKIQPGQPQYAEAQQEIAGWNKDILTIAKQRAQQKNFDTAILATNLISQDQPIYTESKGSLGKWCTSLRLYRGQNPEQHKQAKNICRTQVGR